MGNPGESGFGFVLKDESGIVLEEVGRYIGHATNNVAEYRGLLGCLEHAETYKPDVLIVYSDSELLVKQIRGEYRVKSAHLKELFLLAQRMIWNAPFDFEIHHIGREGNKTADGLARRAIRLRSDTADAALTAGPQRQSG